MTAMDPRREEMRTIVMSLKQFLRSGAKLRGMDAVAALRDVADRVTQIGKEGAVVFDPAKKFSPVIVT